MQITIDTAALTDLDRKVLALLTGGEEAPAKAVAEPKKTTPKAKAAAPAPAPEKPVEAAPEPVEAKPEPEAAPAVDEPEEDLVGGSPVTMKDAVARATELVSSGKSAAVREALAKFNAKRVSDVADDDLAGFVAELG